MEVSHTKTATQSHVIKDLWGSQILRLIGISDPAVNRDRRSNKTQHHIPVLGTKDANSI